MNPKPISTYDPSSVSCLGEGIFDAFFSKWINDECVSNTLVSNGYNNMCHFPFTGKEKDEETGFHYFGARYYDSEVLTGWLSVDPMADKYPSISSHAYCAWNPMKLVDPDGQEIWIGTYKDRKRRKYIPNNKGNTGVAAALDEIYKSKAGRYVVNLLIKSKKDYFISVSAHPSGNENPTYVDANNQIYLNTRMLGLNPYTLSHELFHAFQDENGIHGSFRSKEVEAFIFAGIVLSQVNNGKAISTLTRKMPSGMAAAFTQAAQVSRKSKEYVSAMFSLTQGFSAAQMRIAVSRFLNYSKEGSLYRNNYGYCPGNGAGYDPRTSLLNKYSKKIY